MQPARWQRLKPWLEQLLDAEVGSRAAILDALPEADRELRADLEALLREHDAGASLDQGAVAIAAPLLDAGQGTAEIEGERVGQQIGPYRLKRLLGSGGMGAVYLAEREQDGFTQRVALKVIRNVIGGGSARKRFDRERQILAELKHPNIAQLLDGGSTAEGAPYYTMEYVEGVPISDFCRGRGEDLRLPLRLMLKVAAALAYAHQRLVIHRDIKPSNILVTAERHVKLLDFGIAKPVSVTAGASLTRGTLGPMTPEYAAPEQFRGGAITVATDIYQFGVLLYRLLSGRLPYDADPHDSLGWARAVTEQEPMALVRALTVTQRRGRSDPGAPALRRAGDPHRLRRFLSGDLDAVVRKALAKRPEDRYRSMDALIADLEAFLRGDPVAARRTGAVDQLRRFVTRHVVAVATGGLFGVALIGATVFALGEARRARDEAARANAAVGFVEEMFGQLDPSRGGARELRAQAMLEFAAARIDRDSEGQPLLLVRLDLLVGNAFATLGDLLQAGRRFEHARTLLRRAPGADPLLVAQVLERSAWTTYRGGQVDAALALLDEAERLLAEVDASDADVAIAIAADRAIFERDRGRYPQSLPHAERALELARRFDPPGGSERAARAQLRLATAYKDVGRFEEAMEQCRSARRWLAANLGEQDLLTVSADESLGWILTSTDRLGEAETLLEAAGTRLREALGPDSTRYGTNLFNRGLLYRRLGQIERAHAAFVQVTDIYAHSSGGESLGLGWALWNLGNLSLQLGRVDEAIGELERADALWQQAMTGISPVQAQLWADLAGARIRGGRSREALQALPAAVQRVRAADLGDDEVLVRLLALQAAAASVEGDAAAATEARAQALREAERIATSAGARRGLRERVETWSALRADASVTARD